MFFRSHSVFYMFLYMLFSLRKVDKIFSKQRLRTWKALQPALFLWVNNSPFFKHKLRYLRLAKQKDICQGCFFEFNFIWSTAREALVRKFGVARWDLVKSCVLVLFICQTTLSCLAICCLVYTPFASRISLNYLHVRFRNRVYFDFGSLYLSQPESNFESATLT